MAASWAWPRCTSRSARASRTSVTSGAASSALRYSAIAASALPAAMASRAAATRRSVTWSRTSESRRRTVSLAVSRAAARRRCCERGLPVARAQRGRGRAHQRGHVVRLAREHGRERAGRVRRPLLAQERVAEARLRRRPTPDACAAARGSASRRRGPVRPARTARPARRPCPRPASAPSAATRETRSRPYRWARSWASGSWHRRTAPPPPESARSHRPQSEAAPRSGGASRGGFQGGSRSAHRGWRASAPPD